MSHTLTQPEEVDLIFMEMAWNDREEIVPETDHRKQPPQERWYGSYIPPYRAMHMKSTQSALNP